MSSTNSTGSNSPALSTTSASAFFSTNLQFFVYGFVVAGVVLLLILLVLVRMRYDAQLRKRYAYESEFDVRKEMLRKAKKKAKEKAKAALVRQAQRQGVPIHTLILNRTHQLPGHHTHNGVHGHEAHELNSADRGPGRAGRGRRGRGRGGGLVGRRMRGDGHDADGEDSDVHDDGDDEEHDEHDELDHDYYSDDSDSHRSHGDEQLAPPVPAARRPAAATGAGEIVQKSLRVVRSSSSASVAPAPAPAEVRPLQLNNLLP